MNAKQDLRFEGFRLDRRNQQLRQDSRLISLRPKSFAVLEYFAENPGRLITRAELLKAVWGPIAVADGLLRWYIRDLRQALGDLSAKPPNSASTTRLSMALEPIALFSIFMILCVRCLK